MKPRTFVRMFQPRFAPLVESGAKFQTIRNTPKVLPRVGDRVSCREWTGKPYRSKQRVLREAEITLVGPVRIEFQETASRANHDFARNDGFEDFWDMLAWFEKTHGLPFDGILIQWKP